MRYLRTLWAIPRWCGRQLRMARTWVLFFLLLIAVLIAYYAAADRYTPYTSDAFVQAYVVQVAPRVQGEVVEVAVRENQFVKEGDLLYALDPRPFAHAVRELEAKGVLARQQVAQLDSELAAAKAEESMLTAEEEYAKAVFQQEERIFKESSTTERKYLDAVQKHKAAQASVARSRAVVRQKEQALAARLESEHALVAAAEAQLANAKLNLQWARVFAPADGYVTNLQLRVGSHARAGEPVLTFIDSGQWWVVANFRENNLPLVRADTPCGVTLSTYPGQIFPGHVESIGWGVGQGQGVPSGVLPAVKSEVSWIRQLQRFPVRVKVDTGDLPLRVGATATVTIYTQEESFLNPIAEAWQQVMAWLDYLH